MTRFVSGVVLVAGLAAQTHGEALENAQLGRLIASAAPGQTRYLSDPDCGTAGLWIRESAAPPYVSMAYQCSTGHIDLAEQVANT
jgi:hypothetical protein